MSSQIHPEVVRLCADAAEIRKKYSCQEVRSEMGDVSDIVNALNEFQECVRYLNTRRSQGAVLHLDSEADVQDALYLMLRPWIPDLLEEDPGSRIASRYTIKDFVSAHYRTVIEAKYIRDQTHGKSISKELHDDIETYRHHINCRHLVFFIYDPDSLIPNQRSLREQIEISRTHGSKTIYCHLIVKP